ncbi:ferredoxin [Phycicoccus flavus]|uniref:ferredoxin n=1 Tax=Phycicoccus flavus TaxID=2502783 RepID=UPI000FEB6A72|nr:ferredoxin [Phycicoccus flavus]NHA70110.1 ferredoxin [Phycicoccus flavus]
MSRSDARPRSSVTAQRDAPREVRVDRVACTGHGICAQLLAGRVSLDPWGYPVVHDGRVGVLEGDRAVDFCPARALYWSDRP